MNLYYTTLGAGPPLLCMHGGLGLDHTCFRPWLDRLADNHTLIYYDHPANGRSPDLPGGRDLDFPELVRAAEALCTELGLERVSVLGHSFGGLVAQEFALRHPERLDHLVLCSTTAAFDYPDQVVAAARARATDEQFEALLGGLTRPVPSDAAAEQMWRSILPLYFHGDVSEVIESIASATRFRAAALNRSVLQLMPEFNTTDRLGSVETPTLVVSGDDDFIMPIDQTASRLHALLPHSRLAIIPEAGHFPWVEKPEAFVEVLNHFLA